MNAKLAEAQSLKEKAGADRERAVEYLEQAIHLLEPMRGRSSERPTDWERAVLLQLADCYGSLGGAYRRRGDLPSALKFYDKGFEIESNRGLFRTNSYNLVNRLLVRLSLDPDLEQRLPDGTSLRDAIREARAEVARQIRGPRRRDMWAHADLVTLTLLAGNLEQARAAWTDFDELAITDHAYTSTRDVLSSLSKRVPDRDARDALVKGLEWFEAAIRNEGWSKLAPA